MVIVTYYLYSGMFHHRTYVHTYVQTLDTLVTYPCQSVCVQQPTTRTLNQHTEHTYEAMQSIRTYV